MTIAPLNLENDLDWVACMSLTVVKWYFLFSQNVCAVQNYLDAVYSTVLALIIKIIID